MGKRNTEVEQEGTEKMKARRGDCIFTGGNRGNRGEEGTEGNCA